LIRKGEEYKNAHYQESRAVILSSVSPVNEAQLAVSPAAQKTSNCVFMRHQYVAKTALVCCVFQPRAYMPTEIALGVKLH